MTEWETLVGPADHGGEGASVRYLPAFLAPAEAAALFAHCRDGLRWRRETDDHGEQGRLSHYCGDPGAVFWFVGLALEPAPWTPALAAVRARLGELHGLRATACLLNQYPEGAGEIVWHSDETRASAADNLIVTLSLGGARRFCLKHPGSGRTVERALAPGSLLVMSGATQEHWLHRLPLDPGPGRAPHRISLTFRSILPGWEAAHGAGAARTSGDELGGPGPEKQ